MAKRQGEKRPYQTSLVRVGSTSLESTVVDLAVLASVVFVFGLVSRRVEETLLTAPLVFVAAGIVLGPVGLGLVDFTLDDHTVLLLGEITLAIVLFTDAARTNLSTLRQNEGLPLRLLGIGMPLTIALGTVVAALVLTDLTFWEAAIVGTVLAPTDAALGQAVVSNPRVPVRVRQALNVEVGLNDGLSVPFLALFLTLAEAEEEHLSANIRKLVQPARAGFDSVGPDRGGGGSAASRARRDRGGGGTYGAAQGAAARDHRCPALGCVRPPCSGDGSGRAREARNTRGADPRGLCATRYSERWVRPGEIQMEVARYLRTSIVNRPVAAEESQPREQ